MHADDPKKNVDRRQVIMLGAMRARGKDNTLSCWPCTALDCTALNLYAGTGLCLSLQVSNSLIAEEEYNKAKEKATRLPRSALHCTVPRHGVLP